MSDTRRKATEDDSQLIEAFSRLETMEIGGFVGIDQVMDPQIKPLDPTMHMAGRALTVRGAMINKGVLDVVQPGDVLVIDTGGDYTTGVWGHLMTMAIRDKGATGVVVDGAVFHSNHLRRLGFPVFARTASSYAGASRIAGGMNVPVRCGGVEVHPGDIVVGDCDGVVVVPKKQAREILLRSQISHEAHHISRRLCEEKGLQFTQLPFIEEQWREKDQLPREKTYVAFVHWLEKVKQSETNEYLEWLRAVADELDVTQ
ncbi:MAG: RraA family protein [Firmicutes bacterium]|jgi:4-hydroxy-4-methyl-2-oxoglutarate aldolase|nr:RraA family protein [Bacillota bacterium]